MAKKGRHPQRPHRNGGGRVTPKGTRPDGTRAPTPMPTPEPGLGPSRPQVTAEPEPEVPEIFDGIVEAVHNDDPLDLLMQASTIMDAVDSRNENPFQRSRTGDPEDETPGLADIVGVLVDADIEMSTYLLAALSVLVSDEVLATRCRGVLANRLHPLPGWLADLGDTAVTGVVEQVHVLGDGDNIMFELVPPGGPAFTVFAYVDHNRGHVVTDAFALPTTMDGAVAEVRRVVDDPDITWGPLDAATARARVADAIRAGAMTWPPYENDTWPNARPLLEWLLTKLPADGVGYSPGSDFDDEAERVTAQVTEAFFASPHGRGLDDADHRGLLDSLCWFGTGYGSNDLLQWSPVRVEILLADWLPRKVMAPAGYLGLAPDLLRAFIGFAHHERGIRAPLTEQTLSAVDEWTPEFIDLINGGDRADEFEGLPGSVEFGDDFADLWDQMMDADNAEWMAPTVKMLLGGLAEVVGGREVLDTLHDAPLVDEAMDFSGIPADILAEVETVVSETDRVCGQALNVEYRTACRRLVHDVAAANPTVFRRRANPQNSAAALAWVIGKANHLFVQSGPGAGASGFTLGIGELMAHFGARSVASRGRSIAEAIGADGDALELKGLGDARYLVATRRSAVIAERDELLELLADLEG